MLSEGQTCSIRFKEICQNTKWAKSCCWTTEQDWKAACVCVCLFFSPGVCAVVVICVYACRHLWLSLVHLFVCTSCLSAGILPLTSNVAARLVVCPSREILCGMLNSQIQNDLGCSYKLCFSILINIYVYVIKLLVFVGDFNLFFSGPYKMQHMR